jgi:hypothetical protein
VRRHISQSPGGGLRSMASVTGVMLRVGSAACCCAKPAVADRTIGNPSADAFRRRLNMRIPPLLGYSDGSLTGGLLIGKRKFHASWRR